MFKKITTIIPVNHKVMVRKAVVLTGVTLGIAIGILLNKVEDPDVVVIEEFEGKSDDESDKEWQGADPKILEGDTTSE